MNKKTLLVGLACILMFHASAQNTFSIEDIIDRAKQQSIFSKQAETQRETSYWQYRSFRTIIVRNLG
jgi:hypothetical protein